jgi:hypothetical protein
LHPINADADHLWYLRQAHHLHGRLRENLVRFAHNWNVGMLE